MTQIGGPLEPESQSSHIKYRFVLSAKGHAALERAANLHNGEIAPQLVRLMSVQSPMGEQAVYQFREVVVLAPASCSSWPFYVCGWDIVQCGRMATEFEKTVNALFRDSEALAR